MKTRMLSLVAILSFAAFLLVGSNDARAEDFYAGKTIRVIVGFSAGGGYDTYARAVARHLGKYIPGNPAFTVENMDGAGSLIAANYTMSRADPDGLTLGVWNSAFVLYQALGDRAVRIDGRKLNWIGAPVKGSPHCSIMASTGLKTIDDVVKSGKPIKMGATRAGSTFNDLPKILNQTVGTKFDVITGYKGTSKIRVAMQSHEVDGGCWGWESAKVVARSMLDAEGKDKLIPIINHKKWDDPEVKDLPTTPEYIKAKAGDDGLGIYKAWVGQYEFQRPFVAPPGVPEDRVKILRDAFDATFKDPQFLAESKKAKLYLDHVPAKEIYEHVESILGISEKQKEDLSFLLPQKKKKK
jgi:tripartite-type tricarboxylate transporter receptor subunit TctC